MASRNPPSPSDQQVHQDAVAALVDHFDNLPFEWQTVALQDMQSNYKHKAEAERKELLARIAELDALTGRPDPALPSKQAGDGRTGKPAPAKYRSKKEPDVTWSGRGADPKWLRAEMEETGEPKEAFLIQQAAE
jgi:DNA-binding protein H-NS